MGNAVIRKIERSDRDWVLQQHIDLYAKSNGFDVSFGTLVEDVLDDFFATHDPTFERGWIAEENGQRLGSVFCRRLSREQAQLRLFFLVPEARGKGLGQRMAGTLLEFAKDKGYQEVRLWTHRSHAAACRLYKAMGWKLIDSEETTSFGQKEIVETYSYRL